MLNEPTFQRLITMRLRGLAEAWQQQQSDTEIGQLGFSVLDLEKYFRFNRNTFSGSSFFELL